MLDMIPYLFSFSALALTAYFAFRKEGQEEKQLIAARLAALEINQGNQIAREETQGSGARLDRLEVGLANQLARQQGFQAEIEGVADYGKRERAAMLENTTRDHNQLREMIKDMPAMRELVYRMVERLENTSKAMDRLDGKMDRIVELLTHK